MDRALKERKNKESLLLEKFQTSKEKITRMRKIKSSSFTVHNEKFNFAYKESVPMCHQYLYGKIIVHAPTFIEKGKQL